jgi:hypothetical protein
VSAEGFINQAKAQFSDFHFGLYRARVEVVWGSTNSIETSKTWLFLFPWQALTFVLAGLIVFVVGVRQYNSWIVSRSSKSK